MEAIVPGLSFPDLFAANEQDNDETNGLVKLLTVLRAAYGPGGTFDAKEIADAINAKRASFASDDDRAKPAYKHADDIISGIADATSPLPHGDVQSFKVGQKLKAVTGQVVVIDNYPHRLEVAKKDVHGHAYKVARLG